MSRISLITALLMLVSFMAVPAICQDGVTSRSITSDAFAKNRPARAASPRPKRVQYRLSTAYKNPFRKKPVQPTVQKGTVKETAAPIAEIGVTFWKLRPPAADERSSFLFPVLDQNKNRQMWLAERAGAETVFKAGDKVRIGIESSVAGYLYIVNREINGDGSFGPPSLIFPESPGDDNSISPAILFDIPDQREDVPYYNIAPTTPDHVGELLTVIISPTRLRGLESDADGNILSLDTLSQIEFESDATLYARNDEGDRIYTDAESSSACGTKARKLEREKSAGPCGTKTRKLTRDEALPATIYRVKAPAGKPLALFLKL